MINIEPYTHLVTPEQFIAHAGGDIRLAESAAWQIWQQQGKPQRDGHALMAIAIADIHHGLSK